MDRQEGMTVPSSCKVRAIPLLDRDANPPLLSAKTEKVGRALWQSGTDAKPMR
jgi:hypothetical protein